MRESTIEIGEGSRAALTISRPRRLVSRLTLCFWGVAVLLGVSRAWESRFFVPSDALSYLELAGAAAHRDWPRVVNAVWSPLYPVLVGGALAIVKPRTFGEVAVAESVNVLILIAAIGAFELFLAQLLKFRRMLPRSSGRQDLPDSLLVVFAHLVCLWGVFDLITVENISPDLLVMVFQLLMLTQLLRMRMGANSQPEYLALGALMGFGYLAKAPLLPFGLIVLACAALRRAEWRRAIPKATAAAVVAAALIAPFAAALSRAYGRPTLGESAAYNYARFVNGAELAVDWQGGPAALGKPVHPTRQLTRDPAVYEFASPIPGSYPPWTDPAYWYEGARPHLDILAQLKALARGVGEYAGLLRSCTDLLMALATLMLFAGRRRSAAVDIGRYWPILLPCLTALLMFGLIHVTPRYVGGAAIVVLVTLFASIRLPTLEGGLPAARAAAGSALLLAILHWGPASLQAARTLAADALGHGDTANPNWDIAQALGRLGVRKGEGIGFIGDSYRFYWARLAGVRVIAEVRSGRSPDVARFWGGDAAVRGRTYAAFEHAGARVLVADKVPDAASELGWLPLASTGYSVHFLASAPLVLGPAPRRE